MDGYGVFVRCTSIDARGSLEVLAGFPKIVWSVFT